MHMRKDKLNKNYIGYNSDHTFILYSYLGTDAYGNGAMH